MDTIFYVLMFTLATGSGQTYKEMDALLEYLFNASRYNRLLRPLQNQSHVMEVNLTQYFTSIEYFDISSGDLLVTGYFEIRWKDELLRWDPTKYGGKEFIPLQKDMIWKPEISVSSMDGDHVSLIGNSDLAPVLVDYQGFVLAVPGGRFKTRCMVDTTLYPFDKHKCSFQFLVSNHDISEVMLYAPSGDLDTKNMMENGEWMIENSNAVIVVLHDEKVGKLSIAMSEVSFDLKRRAAFEIVNTFAYVTLMTFLNTLTCFVRPDSGERLSFAVTLYLALVFASTTLIERLPNNSLKMAYMSYNILIINIFNTATVGWSIFIVHLASTPANAPLPLHRVIKNIVIKKRQAYANKSNKVSSVNPPKTAVDSLENEEISDRRQEAGNSVTEVAIQISGIEVAKVLDKVYFVFICSFLFITIVVFTIIVVFDQDT